MSLRGSKATVAIPMSIMQFDKISLFEWQQEEGDSHVGLRPPQNDFGFQQLRGVLRSCFRILTI